METDGEAVMPPEGTKADAGRGPEGVVVPREDGESSKARDPLAELPVAPVNGAAEGTIDADFVHSKW